MGKMGKIVVAAVIFLCCGQLIWATGDKPDLDLQEVKLRVEVPSVAVRTSQWCDIRIEVHSKSFIQHLHGTLNEVYTLKLPEGEYQINAAVVGRGVGPLRHRGVSYFSIPGPNTIRVKLEKVKKHRLQIKVLDEKQTTMERCKIHLFFDGSVQFMGIPRLVGADGTGKTEVTDANGLVTFELEGPVPECNIRVNDQSFSQPDKKKIPPSSWDCNEPFVVTVKRKIVNGKIECYIQKDGKIYPFVDWLDNVCGTTKQFVVARLIRAKPEIGQQHYFDIRFEDGLFSLYGLEDGDYFFRRVDVFGHHIRTKVYPLINKPISIRNGLLLEADQKLVLAQEREREFPVQIRVTDGRKGIADVSVRVLHPLTDARVITDKHGRCSVNLAEGKYKVTARNRKYAIASRQVYIDPNNAVVKIQLKALPLVKGRITLAGKPVKTDQVIAAFDLDRNLYVGSTDDNGNFEIPLKSSGTFILCVTFDGFSELWQLNTAEATSKELNLELTPRREITVTISGKYSEIIEEKAVLYIFPKGMGLPAASCQLPSSGIATTKIIEGTYTNLI